MNLSCNFAHAHSKKKYNWDRSFIECAYHMKIFYGILSFEAAKFLIWSYSQLYNCSVIYIYALKGAKFGREKKVKMSHLILSESRNWKREVKYKTNVCEWVDAWAGGWRSVLSYMYFLHVSVNVSFSLTHIIFQIHVNKCICIHLFCMCVCIWELVNVFSHNI